MSGTFGEGVGDVSRGIYGGFGEAYQAALRGETAPESTMTGTMQNITPGEEPKQTISAAILEHGRSVALEQEAEHWRNVEAEQMPQPGLDPDPNVGSEPNVETGPGMVGEPQEPDIG